MDRFLFAAGFNSLTFFLVSFVTDIWLLAAICGVISHWVAIHEWDLIRQRQYEKYKRNLEDLDDHR